MVSQNDARWIGIALLTLTGISPILVALYNAIFRSGLLANFSIPPMSGLGISLGIVGILLPVIRNRYRQHSHRFDKVQDWSLAIVFILVGIVFYFLGGVFEDPWI